MDETPATLQQQQKMAEKDSPAPKEFRKRKKRLLQQIANQMDFYFSSANITKDRFMGSLLRDSPYVDLETFFKFNKLRSMTNDIAFLRKAISKSSLLELSEDGLQVRRKVAVEVKGNVLHCTIYVENIPSNADHDWVRQVFGQYGTIDYISLPRYHRSGRPKGFAFVEFKVPEMANSALEAFGALECKIPPTTDPAELQSIKAFEGNTEQQVEGDSHVESHSDNQSVEKESDGEKSLEVSVGEGENVKKRKLDSASEEINEKKRKKSKEENKSDDMAEQGGKEMDASVSESQQGTDGGEEPTSGKEESKSDDMTGQEEKEMDASESEPQRGTDGGEEPSSGGKKKKKKRKRKKREKEVIDSIYLRVMSKEDWKKLRNKYLNTQRENMRLLKMQLQERYHQEHFRQRHTKWNMECDQNHDMEQTQEAQEAQEEAVADSRLEKDQSLKPQFTPNSVIKISFEEPPHDPKKLKDTVKEGSGVAYVDVSATERDVFVRFTSEEAAAAYRKTGCWSRMEILSGTEEEEYWDRILSCWTQRRNKKSKQNGKQSQSCIGELRGREKLFLKAFRDAQNTKCNSHIVFDD
ncbi:la-related protein 7-like [Portunus trituberculatus]|uniref:La-related protein 7 n=1 Tax=Portunus trituberculatus TaxID=210409 RepID=A0A5B7GNR8_PORTR|nr:la-related protein 7-like [Portunus trituberculatus]XP_045102950.1 la-related protein 7-like [Portunus trituberculatus]MPC59213.1 La-related protein 7 [Portunus trituberculatus]